MFATAAFAVGALFLPTFAAVVVQRVVLLVGIDEIIGSPELVTLMWRMEMAAFLVNALPMAAAILGIAGSRAGLLPAWFARWSPVAAIVDVAHRSLGRRRPRGLAGRLLAT